MILRGPAGRHTWAVAHGRGSYDKGGNSSGESASEGRERCRNRQRQLLDKVRQRDVLSSPCLTLASFAE